MKKLTLSMLPALLVILSGCATSQSAASEGRDPDVITNEEIQDHLSYTALEIIQRVRRNWLRDRGGSINVFGQEDIQNPRGIRVYFDGVEQREGLRALELLSATEVSRLEKLDAGEATQRFGLGHTAGAILVTTNRR